MNGSVHPFRVFFKVIWSSQLTVTWNLIVDKLRYLLIIWYFDCIFSTWMLICWWQLFFLLGASVIWYWLWMLNMGGSEITLRFEKSVIKFLYKLILIMFSFKHPLPPLFFFTKSPLFGITFHFIDFFVSLHIIAHFWVLSHPWQKRRGAGWRYKSLLWHSDFRKS